MAVCRHFRDRGFENYSILEKDIKTPASVLIGGCMLWGLGREEGNQVRLRLLHCSMLLWRLQKNNRAPASILIRGMQAWGSVVHRS